MSNATRTAATRSALVILLGAALARTAAICAGQAGPATAPVTATAPTTEPVATQPAASATTSPTTAQSAAAALIDLLSSSDPRQRRRAAEALITLGEDARPSLEDLLERTNDLDVITRAQAALEQIDEDRAIGPSYVTMHLKNASAGEVAAELARQGMAPLRTFPENLWDDPSIPRITIDVDHQPFWVAARQLSEQAGVNLQPWADGIRWMRVAGRPSGVAVVDGPFLVVATQINRIQAIQLGANGVTRSDFSVQMFIYPEPKIVVVWGASSLEVQEAVDDKGNSLVGAAPQRLMPVFGDATMGLRQLVARLEWPQNPGKRIARLACVTSLELQTKSQKMEIPDILTAPAKTQTMGASTISFKGIHKNMNMWELELTASVTAPAQQLVQNRVQLLDAQGRPLQQSGMSARQDGGIMTFRLLFVPSPRPDIQQAGDPSRLIWEVPAETKKVQIPFEFHDLPMPD